MAKRACKWRIAKQYVLVNRGQQGQSGLVLIRGREDRCARPQAVGADHSSGVLDASRSTPSIAQISAVYVVEGDYDLRTSGHSPFVPPMERGPDESLRPDRGGLVRPPG
jgi:hypothetical protein